MKTVTVFNLSTLQEIIFMDVVPSEAVLFAYFASISLNNTWEWPKLYLKFYRQLSWGRHTVAMGDFCALTRSM